MKISKGLKLELHVSLNHGQCNFHWQAGWGRGLWWEGPMDGALLVAFALT